MLQCPELSAWPPRNRADIARPDSAEGEEQARPFPNGRVGAALHLPRTWRRPFPNRFCAGARQAGNTLRTESLRDAVTIPCRPQTLRIEAKFEAVIGVLVARRHGRDGGRNDRVRVRLNMFRIWLRFADLQPLIVFMIALVVPLLYYMAWWSKRFGSQHEIAARRRVARSPRKNARCACLSNLDESCGSGRFGASKRGGDDVDLDVSPTAMGGSIAGAAPTARRRSTPPTTPAARAS